LVRRQHKQIALVLSPGYHLAGLVDCKAHVFAGVDLHHVLQVRRHGRPPSVLLIIEAELAVLVLAPQVDAALGIECQHVRLPSGQLRNGSTLAEQDLADTQAVVSTDAVGEPAPAVDPPVCGQQEAVELGVSDLRHEALWRVALELV